MTTEKKKPAAEPTTFHVATWMDQLKEQNERMLGETEKAMKQVMDQGQRMFDETQKTMAAQFKLQQDFMESMLDTAKSFTAR